MAKPFKPWAFQVTFGRWVKPSDSARRRPRGRLCDLVVSRSASFPWFVDFAILLTSLIRYSWAFSVPHAVACVLGHRYMMAVVMSLAREFSLVWIVDFAALVLRRVRSFGITWFRVVLISRPPWSARFRFSGVRDVCFSRNLDSWLPEVFGFRV